MKTESAVFAGGAPYPLSSWVSLPRRSGKEGNPAGRFSQFRRHRTDRRVALPCGGTGRCSPTGESEGFPSGNRVMTKEHGDACMSPLSCIPRPWTGEGKRGALLGILMNGGDTPG